MDEFQISEMEKKKRFAFGANWKKFTSQINDERIEQAKLSLKESLGVEDLTGKSFLDIGCGSGLFSLAAHQLGARVVSFDFDDDAVECTQAVKANYADLEPGWKIFRGSILDTNLREDLGSFDYVYSWGVLHHTGDMWSAISCAEQFVDKNGFLLLALYNDQGFTSQAWKKVKKLYIMLPPYLRWLVLIPSYIRLWGPTFLKDTIRLNPFYTWKNYINSRGMSPHIDVVDWVGGFPFEVATPDEIFSFFFKRNYELISLKTAGGGLGCNEFVFARKN